MVTDKWNDLSYDGRKLRQIVRRLYSHLDNETKPGKKPNWDKIIPKLEAASRISHRHAKLVEVKDLEERTTTIEKLLSYIPAHVMIEAKHKAGL